jgi:hypothetical protein
MVKRLFMKRIKRRVKWVSKNSDFFLKSKIGKKKIFKFGRFHQAFETTEFKEKPNPW